MKSYFCIASLLTVLVTLLPQSSHAKGLFGGSASVGGYGAKPPSHHSRILTKKSTFKNKDRKFNLISKSIAEKWAKKVKPRLRKKIKELQFGHEDESQAFLSRRRGDISNELSPDAERARDQLDQQIDYLLYNLPLILDDGKAALEKAQAFKNIKATTQGWSIVLAGLNDAISSLLRRNETLATLSANDLHNFGGTIMYGFGFGGSLLLGQTPILKDCGSQDLERTLSEYGLDRGIKSFFDYGRNNKELTKTLVVEFAVGPDFRGYRINEFELIARLKLNCILGDEDSNIRAGEASWAFDQLLKAMNQRLEFEAVEE